MANTTTGKHVWKDLVFFIIFFAILAFLFEMISSMIFNRKYSADSFAIVQLFSKFSQEKPNLSLYHEVHARVRPDSTPESGRMIADAIWEANKYAYEPLLQFKVVDFQSTYVNISGFDRKSIPSAYHPAKSSDTVDIYFFGGSTMYGYNLSDAETIPSQFLQQYAAKNPGGPSVRIRNIGVPYYYSKQELMLLTKFLLEGRQPDIVVFMDGLNDFYPSHMLYYDRPHFSYAMQQVFDEKMYQKTNRTILDTSDQFYIDPPHIPKEEYYDALTGKYLNNIRQASRLAQTNGAKSFFFCQPVPFYNYPNRDNDPISYKISYDRFDYIYPKLKQVNDTSLQFTYLGDMLEEEKGLPFVDQVHYSPEFAGKIAARMLTMIEPAILNK